MANVAAALVVLVKFVTCTLTLPLGIVTLFSVKLPTAVVVLPSVIAVLPNVALLFVR